MVTLLWPVKVLFGSHLASKIWSITVLEVLFILYSTTKLASPPIQNKVDLHTTVHKLPRQSMLPSFTSTEMSLTFLTNA